MTNDAERLERLSELAARAAADEIDPAMIASVLDNLPDGVVVIDESGRIRLVNRQVVILFGYGRRALIGEPVHILLAPELREQHSAHLAKFFRDPVARSMFAARTLQGRRANGEPVPVQISIGPVESPTSMMAMAVIRRVGVVGG